MSTLLPSSFSLLPLLPIANMLKQQGLNVLLNLFFGVAFILLIQNQPSTLFPFTFFLLPLLPAVNQLVGNFQQAFNPHCRVPLLICRERDVLAACARQFLVSRGNLAASSFRFAALSTNAQFNYQERIKQL